MRIFKKKTLGILLPIALLLISSHVLADEPPQGDQPSGVKEEISTPAPDLADIIPLVTKLSGRLSAIEHGAEDLLDVSLVVRTYAGIEANLKGPADQIKRLKDSKEYRFNKLVELRERIQEEDELFEKNSKPLSKAIRQFGAWREEWLTEKKRWNEWQSSLLEKGAFDQLKTTFSKANETIDTALNVIHFQLETMLTVQEKAGNIQAKIDALATEIDSMIRVGRRGVLLDRSPQMFSSRYFSQFGSEMRHALQKGLDEISWPSKRFFIRQGWVVLLQGFLSLFVIIAVYRNREILKGSKRWRFIAARPLSAGFFLGVVMTLVVYDFGPVPATWKLALAIVAQISFARLLGGLIETSWKRHFVYGLIFLLIVTRFMHVISLPLPLFRLYLVLTALVGLLFCFRWAGESVRHKNSGFYAWALRLGAFFFLVIIIAEVWGKEGLAEYLFVSSIRSIAILFLFVLLMPLIGGLLEWLFHSSFLQRTTGLYRDTDAAIHKVALFIDVALWGLFVLPAILMLWDVYDSLEEAMRGLLTIGFNLGSQRISVGLVLTSAGILYGSYLLSWILQKLLMDKVLVRRRVEMGVRLSIGRLIHYVLIFLGFILALLALGFEFTKLTIMVSALGVGIGFGLQSVVNNFVSGLILLFERPVRVGDAIELNGKWAEIKKIGLRATLVQTLDQADVIVPNADLVTNPVTNWTLSKRQIRITIPVGVAYGSDVPLVIETLMACANASSMVAKRPGPQVLFLSFGESSLDFELRVWVWDAKERLKAKSELHQEIDQRFREAKIEIAFPQRDLHLRGLDESVILRPPERTG